MVFPEYIFETSWEVCNMVGGIYTVLSTRANTLQQLFPDRIVFIGPDSLSINFNPLFEESTELFPGLKAYCQVVYQLNIRIGRWNIPGKPLAFLVDFMPLMDKKNEIYGKVWEQTGVNSMAAYGDYDESSMFGYASGMIVEGFYRFFELKSSQRVVAHFNEWMTSFGIFYLRAHVPEIATLFTTHATSIGRSIAGNHKPLYDYLNEYNGDQMAYELNMVSKHSTEKIAANLCDCFTTVSQITARECKQLLGKQPDIITPNGFEPDFVPDAASFDLKRQIAVQSLRRVAETLLGYSLPNDVLFIGTAGRYEYKNKGIDTFIESMKYLSDKKDLTKTVVAFIMVPANIRGVRADLISALNHPETPHVLSNRFTTHELHDYYNDFIMSAIHWFHFGNLHSQHVKIIFVPSYLNGSDGVFNFSYYDLLIGMDLTVFPSYYEPWGYTPLESVAFSVPTITTDLSGFGQWVSMDTQDISTGVGVIHRSDYNGFEVATNIAEMVKQFAGLSDDERNKIRHSACSVAEKARWKYFIKFYLEAYEFAIQHLDKRLIN